MLLSLVLELDPAEAFFTGQAAHGWFLGTLLRERCPELATALHAPGMHKPFTIGRLVSAPSGDADRAPGVLRITSVSPVLSTWLRGLTPRDFGHLTLGGQPFTVVGVHQTASAHGLADVSSLGAIWRTAATRPPTGRVRLRFISPTAFDHDLAPPEAERDRRNTLFPAAALVFASLARGWNAAVAMADGDESLLSIPDGAREALLRVVREEEYVLQTVPPVRFDRFSEKAFVGECAYSVGPGGDADLVFALHLLASFAFFSGVGLRRTMGMGQTVPAG